MDEEKDTKWLYGNDWSELKIEGYGLKYSSDTTGDAAWSTDYFFEQRNSMFGFTPIPLNLGICHVSTVKRDHNDIKINDCIKTSNYIGVMPLLPRYDVKEEGKSMPNVCLAITPRFGIQPNELLNAVLEGDDYFDTPEILTYASYTIEELQLLAEKKTEAKAEVRKKVLFGRIKGVGKIDLKQIGKKEENEKREKVFCLGNVYEAFEIIDFIKKTKDVCKRNLKKQSLRIEENLNCKVKGRILVQKQIKYNESRGQYQKVYCAYNKMNENIRENVILKYALYLCEKSENRIIIIGSV